MYCYREGWDAAFLSGGLRCALIGVPCNLSMLSTFSTFANVLFEGKSPRAEGAKTAPPARAHL